MPGFLILIFAVLVNNASTNTDPLHIVIAIADDLGWSDVGYHNASGIKTPYIDQLAQEGIILTNHYVQPLCSPSRASLLTGKYPIHLGAGLNENVFSPDEDIGLPLSETLLPEKMKELGYKTALFGKWHLGSSKTGYLPTRRGFDRFYGFYSGAIDYYLHNQTAHRCKKLKRGASFLDFRDQERIVRDRQGEYSSGIFDDEAVKFIKEYNAKDPLFLVMSYQNVHDPLQVPLEYSSMFKHIADSHRRTYAGMAFYLDNSVRLLKEAMVSRGLWKNTLFLFMSDNGGNPTFSGYNWPLRGAKGTLWEGGIRSVSFLSGGFLKARGFESDALIHVTDWFPTFLNLAKANKATAVSSSEMSSREVKRLLRQGNLNAHVYTSNKTLVNKVRHSKTGKAEVDGIDAWQSLSKPGRTSQREYIVHNINSHSYAIRKGKWKLISELDMGWLKPPEGTPKSVSNISERPLDPKVFTGYLLDSKLPRINNGLFDLSCDKVERYDLSKKHPEIVNELFEMVQKYNKTMVAHDRDYKCNGEALKNAKENKAWGPFSS